tara:strand:- start:438 stop:575 length:138 start_codon:yes stop_codon:yes gene_type:complete
LRALLEFVKGVVAEAALIIIAVIAILREGALWRDTQNGESRMVYM